MAIVPRDMPITRDDVRSWLIGWKRSNKASGKSWEDFLRQKVDALNLPDPMVDTTERDDYPGSQVHIVDLILADMDSYG